MAAVPAGRMSLTPGRGKTASFRSTVASWKTPEGGRRLKEEVVTRIKRSRLTVALGLGIVFMLIAGASLLRAEEGDSTVVAKRARRRHHRVTTTYESTTSAAPPVGRSIDELQGQVSNLRQQTVETNT